MAKPVVLTHLAHVPAFVPPKARLPNSTRPADCEGLPELDGAVEFGHEHGHHMHEAAPPPGRNSKPSFHVLHSPDCASHPGPSHTFHILRTLLPRLLATSLGAALMAVLAIWA